MDEFKQEIRRYFQNSLIRLMSRDNLSQVDLAALIGVSPTTINNWVLGYNVPRMDRIDQLADVFHVPRSELIGDPMQSPISYYRDPDVARLAEQISTNPDLRLLFDAAKDVAPEDLSAVHQILKSMKKKETEGDEE